MKCINETVTIELKNGTLSFTACAAFRPLFQWMHIHDSHFSTVDDYLKKQPAPKI
jgi:hypothetical protein